MRGSTQRIAFVAAIALWSAAGSAQPPEGDKPGRGPRPHGSAARPPGPFHGPPRGSADAGEPGRRGELRREALKARMEELKQTRKDRRQKQLEAFRKRYPPELFADQRAREEFRVHARRMARLRRAELVANNELEEPKRGAVLARIDTLRKREQARHEKRLAKLESFPVPPGSASGRPHLATPKGSAP